MKNNTLTVLTIIVFCTILSGQQERQVTQFMYNKLAYNPAVTGTATGPVALIFYRKQWINIEAAPETKQFSFHSPAFHGRAGFGVNVTNSQIGITNNWQASMSYAYGIQFTEKLTLQMGVQGGLKTYGIDFNSSKLDALDPGDPVAVNHPEGAQKNLSFGAGLYLFSEHFYMGLSSPNFYARPLNVEIETMDEEPHFYAMTGAEIPLGDKFALTPAVFFKYTINAPFDLDAHIGFRYADRFNAGVSYRLGGDGKGDSVDFLLFYHLSESLGLGTAYDFSLSKFKEKSNGSIELLLQYIFKRKKRNISNPRFFQK